MSEKKDKKFPIKIKTLKIKPQEELNNSCELENKPKSRKLRKTTITTEIPTHPKIVGAIPPWDDDDDSQQDDKTQPPNVTAEIPTEDEKINIIPRATGEIPPWDDEEESK